MDLYIFLMMNLHTYFAGFGTTRLTVPNFSASLAAEADQLPDTR